jgi:predicted DCC family thiol-disulfide oxidoreductase YuxK
VSDVGPVWLFDGVCVLCSSGVRYVLKHERHHDMRFIAIQSDLGKALALLHGIDPENPDSFLFIEDNRALAKSDGVLALLRHINGPARVLRLGKVLPKPVRDWLYDSMARNRYRLFGKYDSCMIPDAEMQRRFVLPESPSR